MKSMLLSLLLATTIAFAPACEASENNAGKAAASKNHKASKKHKKHKSNKKHRVTKRPRVAKAPPVAQKPRTAAQDEPAHQGLAAPSAASVSPAVAARTFRPMLEIEPTEMPPAPTATETLPPAPARPVNPYMPVASAAPTAPVAMPAQLAPVPVPAGNPYLGNPYLGNPYLQPVLIRPVAVTPWTSSPAPATMPLPSGSWLPVLPSYAPYGMVAPPSAALSYSDITRQLKGLVPAQISDFFTPDEGSSHWPLSFKKVYPTGEKPLLVMTLKCPTEAAFGVAPPPVKLVHVILTTAMDGINYTNLLPVTLQQVCQ